MHRPRHHRRCRPAPGSRRAVACAGREARQARTAARRRCAGDRTGWSNRSAEPRRLASSTTSKLADRRGGGGSGYGRIGSHHRSQDTGRLFRHAAPGSQGGPGPPARGSYRRDTQGWQMGCACLPRWEGPHDPSPTRVNRPPSTQSEQEPPVQSAPSTVTSAAGSLPLLNPMSEVAGRLAPQVGAHMQIPTIPDGYSDLKPDTVPTRSRTGFRFEAGRDEGAPAGR